MPRVNIGKSQEQLAAEAKDRHREEVLSMIRAQMGAKNISRTELSDMARINYDKMGRILRGSITLNLWDAAKIAEALKFSTEQRAALLGGKTAV